MVESLKKCPACDSVLRPNAVFCHHCGRSLANTKADSPVVETQNLSNENLLPENNVVIAEASTVSATKTPVETLKEAKLNNEAASKTELTGAESVNSQSEIDAPTKNAAQPINAATPRTKRYVNRTEYVWTETTAPTWRIVLFSLLAFALVGLLLWLNNFLR